MTKVKDINNTIKLIGLSLVVAFISFNSSALAQQGIPSNSPGINPNTYSQNSINTINPNNNLQSVQSFRQQTFNYLTSQPNLTSNLMNNTPPVNQVTNSLNNNLPGVTNVQQYNAAMQPHFDQSIAALPNSSAPETQVLSAGVTNQVIKTNVKRAGFSNNLSAIAGFGFGPMVYSTMARPNYGNPLGLAFQALGYTGFGTRNGFRY